MPTRTKSSPHAKATARAKAGGIAESAGDSQRLLRRRQRPGPLDDEHRARVRLTIANVPRRAGTRIKRTLRGGKGRKDAPGIVIEEVDDDDDDAGSHLEDTGGRRDGAMNAPASVNGVSDMRASPSCAQNAPPQQTTLCEHG